MRRIKSFCSWVWPYLLFIAFTYILLNYQISHHILLTWFDTRFHFARFYDIAMQLKTGKFNFFQMNFTFHQCGRIINALYGSGFALLNSLLLLLAGTWYNYQLLTDFLICLIAAASMLHLLAYLKIKKTIAVIYSLIYLSVGMIPNYLNGMTFNAWGQAFMPWVVLCGVKMVRDKRRPVNWIALMLIMTLMAQTHLLSTMMAVLLLLPFFIVALFKVARPLHKIIIPVLKAIIGSIFLTGNIWAPILVVKLNNNLANPGERDLADRAISLTGYNSWFGNISDTILPLFTVLVIIQLFYIIFHFKEDSVNTIATISGSLFLLIATVWFPWSTLQKMPHLTFLRSYLQLPYRLTVIAYPLLLVGFSLTQKQLSKNKRKTRYLILVLLLMLFAECGVSAYRYTNRYFGHRNTAVNSKKITRNKYAFSHNLSILLKKQAYGYAPDYLPTNVASWNPQILPTYIHVVQNREQQFRHRINQDGSLTLIWHKKAGRQIYLPLVLYRQSQLIVNGEKFIGKCNVINNPLVTQKKGQNSATLRFQDPFWCRLFLRITVLAWFLLFCSGVASLFLRYRHHKDRIYLDKG